ncbi:MAG: hypothetical protein Q9204_002581 [Flavoplaca sp. TL-2023a]
MRADSSQISQSSAVRKSSHVIRSYYALNPNFSTLLAPGGSMSETTTSTIDLSDNRPLLIKTMLDVLYTQTFDTFPLATVENQYHPTTFLSNLIDLYALGDKYATPALRQDAATRFQKTISEISESEFNLQCIPQIYDSVPENDTTLKDLLIAEIILRYCSYARARPDQGSLLEAMDQHTEFRKDMTLGLLKNGRGSGAPEREGSRIFGTCFHPFGEESPIFESHFPPLP